MKEKSPLFLRTVALIKAIPKGKVLSYGEVAQYISAPGCSRHVSYILSSSSRKYRLPWHRVIGAGGKISSHGSSDRQIRLLKKEGVEIESGKLDVEEYSWKPLKKDLKEILKGLPKNVSIYRN